MNLFTRRALALAPVLLVIALGLERVSSLPGNVCLTCSDALLLGSRVACQFESHSLRQPVFQFFPFPGEMRKIPMRAGLYAILRTPENRRSDRLQAVSPKFSPCRDDSVSFAGRRAVIRSIAANEISVARSTRRIADAENHRRRHS